MNPLAVAIGAFVAGAASQHFGGRITMTIGTTGALLFNKGPVRDVATAFAFVGAAKFGTEWYQKRVAVAFVDKLKETLGTS